MPDEKFFGIVDQATQLGYSRFGLTPMTGEVYTDPDFCSKLAFLEAHPGVDNYYFFTNLTLASHDDLAATLTDCEKLTAGSKSVFVSVYGHDRESFLEITGGEERHYDRLLSNLAFLAEFLADPSKIEIGFRTFENANPLEAMDRSPEESPLLERVRSLHESGVRVSNFDGEYNNWGGTVTEADMEGLDMELADAKTEKDGPCQLVFNKNIVLPDGEVNACACRDVNATLTLGHTDDQPLDQILSPARNERYSDLIERQNQGDFPAVCETCDYYRSIREFDRMDRDKYTLAEFHELYDPAKDDYKPTR
jgi:hypothetical protein